MHVEFEMSMMEELELFLGIQINQGLEGPIFTISSIQNTS